MLFGVTVILYFHKLKDAQLFVARQQLAKQDKTFTCPS
jgi:hypothetical protein